MDLDRYGIAPDDPDAADRYAVAAYLESRGVTLDQIRSVGSLRETALLAWRQVYGIAGDIVPIEDAAERVGLETDDIERLLRALGFPDPQLTALGLTDADVETLQFFREATTLLGTGEVLHLTRVIGASLARVAEAIVSSIRVNLEAPLRADLSHAEFLEVAESVAAELLPRQSYAFDRILRNHLLRLSEQAWSVTGGAAMTMELAVGFADVVGFTHNVGHLDVAELAELIERFEGGVTDTIAALGGRAVKFIGDEVLFTFSDLHAACLYSLQLVELAADEAIPDIRVGLACGEVVSRFGDYYGPVVNVAARLVDLAPAGTVLVSAPVAERVGDLFELERREPTAVKGIHEPLEHYRLVG